MGKKYRIDHERNIGTVLFVVEGGNSEGGTELRLLKAIFSDLLGFSMKELRRGSDEFIGHGGIGSSTVYGLNLPNNQLTELTEERVDILFKRLRTELKLKPENYPLFFLYDRDVKSYRLNQLRTYVCRYTNPYSDDVGNQGQLLLSYPAVESFFISCLLDGPYTKCYELGRDMKPDAKSLGCTEAAIKEDSHLIHAVCEMDRALQQLGCPEYDVDDLGTTLLQAYDAQQDFYKQTKTFQTLSLISMALLELGILIEDETESENE